MVMFLLSRYASQFRQPVLLLLLQSQLQQSCCFLLPRFFEGCQPCVLDCLKSQFFQLCSPPRHLLKIYPPDLDPLLSLIHENMEITMGLYLILLQILLHVGAGLRAQQAVPTVSYCYCLAVLLNFFLEHLTPLRLNILLLDIRNRAGSLDLHDNGFSLLYA